MDILSSQLKGKERAVDPAATNDDDAEISRSIVRAIIGMVEIWMDPSYDLWYVPLKYLYSDTANTQMHKALTPQRKRRARTCSTWRCKQIRATRKRCKLSLRCGCPNNGRTMRKHTWSKLGASGRILTLVRCTAAHIPCHPLSDPQTTQDYRQYRAESHS